MYVYALELDKPELLMCYETPTNPSEIVGLICIESNERLRENSSHKVFFFFSSFFLGYGYALSYYWDCTS